MAVVLHGSLSLIWRLGGSLVVLGLLAGLTWAPVNVILFLCWMVLLVPPSSLHTTQLQRVEQLLRIGIPIGVILLSGWTAWVAYEAIQDPPLDDYLLDIGFNTYLAADSFLMGLNPYTEICQLYHEIRPQEGVILPENYPLTLGAKGAGDILLYGWPYRHGFPYFPMMFLGYVPFVAFFEGLDAMRMANAVFLVASGMGLYHLARGWDVPRKTSLLPVLALLGVPFLPNELFVAGVTDLWIGVLALSGVLCLQRGQGFGAGVLLGLSQGAKLLPGPLLWIPILLYCWRAEREKARPLLLGLLLGIGVGLLPYVLQDPEYFLSSTIVFYMVMHGMGDSTAIYSELAPSIRPWWSALGVLLSALVVILPNRVRPSLHHACVLGAMGYVLFVAMNRMTHLNYLVGILPFGALVFLPNPRPCRENA